MFVYRVNINSNLDSLINGCPDGEEKDFLIKSVRKKEIDYLPFFAYNIAQEGLSPFIRVKFDWGYGQRARKIDLVGIKGNQINIYKKSTIFAVDSNALDLWRIKQCVEEQFSNVSVCCFLIFVEDVDEDSISSTLLSLDLDVKFKVFK